MAELDTAPRPLEQERRFVGHELDWGEDELFRTIETDAQAIYDTIRETHLGQASPKGSSHAFEDIYGLLSEFGLTTKVTLTKNQGMELGRDIYVPAGASGEFWERWVTTFGINSAAYDEGEYIRIHYD